MQKIFIKNYRKIGILGGTFDPPHTGHLKISIVAIKKLKLDFLIWSITKKNPFKKNPKNKLEDRISFSKNIIKKYKKKIQIVYLEKKIKSKKTIDTLRYVKKKYKGCKIYFLIGADSLINLHKWKKWQEIPRYAKLIVFNRQGFMIKAKKSVAVKKLKSNDWLILKFKKINISSSKIRKI